MNKKTPFTKQFLEQLSNFVLHLMEQRKLQSDSVFVFPGEGQSAHLVEPRKQILRVRKKSGIEFTVHDLRRTFATIAESLDISRYTLKRLLNHKINEDVDVTAGYIVLDQGRLKQVTQKITNHILELVGYKQDIQISIQTEKTRLLVVM